MKEIVTPRTLSEVVRCYPWRGNVKASNGEASGVQKRLKLRIKRIKYIGKETNFLMEGDEGIDGDAFNEGTNTFAMTADAGAMTPVGEEWLHNTKVSISWRIQYLLSGPADKASIRKAIMRHMGWDNAKLNAAARDPEWFDITRDTGARGRLVTHKDFRRFCEGWSDLCAAAGFLYTVGS